MSKVRNVEFDLVFNNFSKDTKCIFTKEFPKFNSKIKKKKDHKYSIRIELKKAEKLELKYYIAYKKEITMLYYNAEVIFVNADCEKSEYHRIKMSRDFKLFSDHETSYYENPDNGFVEDNKFRFLVILEKTLQKKLLCQSFTSRKNFIGIYNFYELSAINTCTQLFYHIKCFRNSIIRSEDQEDFVTNLIDCFAKIDSGKKRCISSTCIVDSFDWSDGDPSRIFGDIHKALPHLLKFIPKEIYRCSYFKDEEKIKVSIIDIDETSTSVMSALNKSIPDHENIKNKIIIFHVIRENLEISPNIKILDSKYFLHSAIIQDGDKKYPHYSYVFIENNYYYLFNDTFVDRVSLKRLKFAKIEYLFYTEEIENSIEIDNPDHYIERVQFQTDKYENSHADDSIKFSIFHPRLINSNAQSGLLSFKNQTPMTIFVNEDCTIKKLTHRISHTVQINENALSFWTITKNRICSYIDKDSESNISILGDINNLFLHVHKPNFTHDQNKLFILVYFYNPIGPYKLCFYNLVEVDRSEPVINIVSKVRKYFLYSSIQDEFDIYVRKTAKKVEMINNKFKSFQENNIHTSSSLIISASQNVERTAIVCTEKASIVDYIEKFYRPPLSLKEYLNYKNSSVEILIKIVPDKEREKIIFPISSKIGELLKFMTNLIDDKYDIENGTVLYFQKGQKFPMNQKDDGEKELRNFTNDINVVFDAYIYKYMPQCNFVITPVRISITVVKELLDRPQKYVFVFLYGENVSDLIEEAFEREWIHINNEYEADRASCVRLTSFLDYKIDEMYENDLPLKDVAYKVRLEKIPKDQRVLNEDESLIRVSFYQTRDSGRIGLPGFVKYHVDEKFSDIIPRISKLFKIEDEKFRDSVCILKTNQEIEMTNDYIIGHNLDVDPSSEIQIIINGN